MDNDNDHNVDYNDVVSFLENSHISKTTEDQAKQNQLFWSVIDQYKVRVILPCLFIFFCFLCFLFPCVCRKEK
jgi:hypothetical protein